MTPEVIATGAPLGEGPVWCPDGTLVITRLGPGMLQRLDIDTGELSTVATMAGGANAAQLATDGGFVVTNNGGLDFTQWVEPLGLDPDSITHDPGTPSLVRVLPDGSVAPLHETTPDGEGFGAPNDLIVGPDGDVWFTDPPPLHRMGRDGPGGRVWERSAMGALRVVADGFDFCNGIALSPEGGLLIVEGGGLMWVDVESGLSDWFVEQVPNGRAGDGFAFDVDGNLFVCCPADHHVVVLDEDGALIETIPLGDDAVPTNCCFGGDDLRTLFVTELAPGRVTAIERLPSPGLALTPWPAPG